MKHYTVRLYGQLVGDVEAENEQEATAKAVELVREVGANGVDEDFEEHIDLREWHPGKPENPEKRLRQVKELTEALEEAREALGDSLQEFFDAVWRQVSENGGLARGNHHLTALTVPSVYSDGESYAKKVLVVSPTACRPGSGVFLLGHFEPDEFALKMLLSWSWKYYER